MKEALKKITVSFLSGAAYVIGGNVAERAVKQGIKKRAEKHVK